MRIILKEKLDNLGSLGDIVNVKPGYARNFLIPFGMAVQATKKNIEIFKLQKVELEKAEQSRLDEANMIAEIIKDKTYNITSQSGDGGKLFGSVGTKEIAESISNQSGKLISKSQIRMPSGVIRNLGEFDLSVQIYKDVVVDIKVNVVTP